MNPSTDDIVAGRAERARQDRVCAAQQQEHHHGRRAGPEHLQTGTIVVLPTRTIPQGITAMLNFDSRDAVRTNNAIDMMQAADKVGTRP